MAAIVDMHNMQISDKSAYMSKQLTWYLHMSKQSTWYETICKNICNLSKQSTWYLNLSKQSTWYLQTGIYNYTTEFEIVLCGTKLRLVIWKHYGVINTREKQVKKWFVGN